MQDTACGPQAAVGDKGAAGASPEQTNTPTPAAVLFGGVPTERPPEGERPRAEPPRARSIRAPNNIPWLLPASVVPSRYAA